MAFFVSHSVCRPLPLMSYTVVSCAVWALLSALCIFIRRGDVKRLTDILTRLFNDCNVKVLSVFVDVLALLVAAHSAELTDWLPTMLPRLLTKAGSDAAESIHAKMLRALDIIRSVCNLDKSVS